MAASAASASMDRDHAVGVLDEGQHLLQAHAPSHLSPAGDEELHFGIPSHPSTSPAAAAVQPVNSSSTPASCSGQSPLASSPATRSHSNCSHYSLQIAPSVPPSTDHLLVKAERAVSMRLLPPLLLLVIISYLDRTALSFASIQMSHDLNLSSSMYGLGSGAFFLAYAAGQIPSNFLLLRFGGPAWLAFICIAWGIAASSMALVQGPVSFVLLRMILGLAESGAFPGTWYYISCWYAPDRTTVPYTVIETGITVSQVIAAPIAAGLLLLDGKLGMRGWQWLFLIEGVPAVLLGCFMTLWLPASIEAARLLSEPQRMALLKATGKLQHASSASADVFVTSASTANSSLTTISCSAADAAVEIAPQGSLTDSEAAQLLHRGLCQDTKAVPDPTGHSTAASRHKSPARPASAAGSLGRAGSSHSDGSSSGSNAPNWRSVVAVARNRVVLYAGSWRILHDIPGNGVLYWTPKIVQALLLAAAAGSAQGAPAASSPGVGVVLFSAIPYAAASLAHLLNAWHSQRVGEAKLHISCTWLLGAVALVVLPFVASGALSGAVSSGSSSMATSVAAFVLLTVAHVGVNGANGLQTGLVAGSIPVDQKALGLAMYNTIACMGSFLGPLLIGIIHDATHGYSVAMWVLGCSLAAAAFMVFRFRAPRC